MLKSIHRFARIVKVVAAEKLRLIAGAIFKAAGSSDDEADIVAQHLVESSLAGVDSHGIIRIPEYIDKIQGKPIPRGVFRIVPNAKITTTRDSGAIAMLDGGWGFGQVAAKKAMELAIEKARKFNIGAVTCCNCDHIGRLAWYSLMAVERGMIGITFAKAAATMAPLGAKGKLIGNNPVSYGIPAGEEKPVVLDYAMSVAAAGKLTVAIDKGQRVPEGWLIDAEGNPTTDPNAFYQGGSLLPFAGHKGYAMGVVGEVLGGMLSGSGVLTEYLGTNAFLNLAINVDSFIPLPDFKSQMDRLIRMIRNAPRVKGVEEIVIPGEPEFKMREIRLKEGVPVAENTWKRITISGREVGVEPSLFD
jgi:uncharacterized oxidoreductase